MSSPGPTDRATEPDDAAFVRGFTAGVLWLQAGPDLARRLSGATAEACAAALARLNVEGEAARAGFLTSLRTDLAMPAGDVARLLGHADGELRQALCERGAGVLGRSLVGAPPATRARAMALVGQPFASLIEEAARAEGVSAAARATAQHAVARAAQVRVDAAGDPRDRLLALGFFDLVPLPHDEPVAAAGLVALAALAGRLPVEVREVFARVCPAPVC